jgi:hypothetical protein
MKRRREFYVRIEGKFPRNLCFRAFAPKVLANLNIHEKFYNGTILRCA